MQNRKLMITKKGNTNPKNAMGQKYSGEMYFEESDNIKQTINT